MYAKIGAYLKAFGVVTRTSHMVSVKHCDVFVIVSETKRLATFTHNRFPPSLSQCECMIILNEENNISTT